MSKFPGGKILFSRAAGRMAPYTGTIGANVEELIPGKAIVSMADRRGLRNHLSSIHAMALANLGEVSSGLALVPGLPQSSRAILVKFEIQYLKKARGKLTAEGKCEVPGVGEEKEVLSHASIRNAAGEEVAHVVATWKVGLKK